MSDAAAIETRRRQFASRPGDPDLARDLALALRDAGRLEEAEAPLDLALLFARDRPDRADLAGLRGELRLARARALMSARQVGAGVALLVALLDGPALSSSLLGGIAGLLVAAGATGPAEAAARRALADAAGSADGWVTLGLALHQQDRLGEALAAYERALAIDPGHVAAACDAAMVHLAHGDLARGFAGFERRRGDVPPLPAPGALAGRHVMLTGEQGFGDTIQFVRYAALVAEAGARVTLRVQPGLVRLLGGMAGVEAVVGDDQSDDNQPGSPADFVLPLASLPLLFGTTLASVPATVPYLAADPVAVARWHGRLAGLTGRKVGLTWAGDPRATLADRAMDARRSVMLAALAPLAVVPGVTLVSLQKGPGAAQRPPAGMVLHDWTDALADFADTAALVAALDLVVTVDTAIAHLAGALGRPVWLLNRHDADWRWLRGRDDCPWYPTLRQFRQTVPGAWGDVVARVAAGLAPGTGAP